MSVEKSIVMRQYNGFDYDTIFPYTTAAQVKNLQSVLDTKQNSLPSSTANKYLHTNNTTGNYEWTTINASYIIMQSAQPTISSGEWWYEVI